MAFTKTYYDTSSQVNSVNNEDIIVVQQRAGSAEASLAEMKKTTVGAIRKPLVDTISSMNSSAGEEDNRFVYAITQSSGVVSASLASFAKIVKDGGDKAPTSDAVMDYLEEELDSNGSITNAINAKIGGINASSAGSSGQYIRSISQSSGVISATPVSFDNVISDSNNAPTSSAVSSFVNGKISALSAEVGGNNVLIKSLAEFDGVISGTTINLDDTLNSLSSGVPTSSAVKAALSSLNAEAGSENTLIKSFKQENGAITTVSATGITNTVVSNSNDIPTSAAVYNYGQSAIYNQLSNLDLAETGADGNYIKKVRQDDGQLGATIQTFDTSITNEATNANAPTTLAAKNYVDTASSSLRQAINDLDYTSSGANGSFVQKVSQEDGMISEVIVPFENLAIASFASSASDSAYSSRTDVAPTVRAVTEQVRRLDVRIDNANSHIEDMNAGPFGTSGSYISEVRQDSGFITASSTAFLASVPSTTGGSTGNIAPSADAVRSAINALNKTQAGTAGAYINAISEASGIITASSTVFDSYTAPNGWSDVPSASNAPSTLAVENRINEAKRQILEESEALTYLGSVTSTDTMCSRASAASRTSPTLFNIGDVFVSKGDFNLNGQSTGDAKYQVYTGDLIFVNSDCDTVVGSKDSFDIVSGSDKTVMFSGGIAQDRHFVMFDGTSGKLVQNSELSPDTILDHEASAAYWASKASDAASYAASSAILASNQIEPYIEAGSKAASLAASYASNSSTAASRSEASSDAASANAAVAIAAANAASDSAIAAASDAVVANTKAVAAASDAVVANTKAVAAASDAVVANTKAVAAASDAVVANTKAANASLSASYASSSASVANYYAGRITNMHASVAPMYDEITVFFYPTAQACSAECASRASAAYLSAAYSSSSATFASTRASVADVSAVSAESNAVIASQAASYAEWYANNAHLEEMMRTASLAASAASSAAQYAETGFLDKITTGNQTVVGSVTFNSTISAVDFTATSSRKMKENIRPTSVSALDLIGKINIVDFNYVSDDEKTPHIGFIAEDTDPLLSTPHLNKMDYTNCIGTLFKAIQELTEEIEILKRRS